MFVILVVGVCSLLASLIMTRFFRDFFAFLEVVDQPDARRKLHFRPVPRVGGIAIAVSYIVALASVLAVGSWWKQLHLGTGFGLLWRLLPALAIVFLTGLLDDFRGLTPFQKLAGQLLGAIWAVAAGVRILPIAGHAESVYWTLPGSVLWLVFCANAFNLIDGLDGLASGIAVLGATGLLMAGVIHHNLLLALAIVPFLGALLGFLYYNFNPASVFLGDCGSLLIGFLIGCFGLIWIAHTDAAGAPFVPLMAVAVPGADVGISITRRFLRRQPIFDADRNHIHHRLLSLGMTQRDAALVLYGVTGLGVVLAVLQTVIQPQGSMVLIALGAAGAYLGIRKLGYVEFRSLAGILISGELRGILRMRICIDEYRDALSAAQSPEECWDAVCRVCVAAGFRNIALEMEGKRFELREATVPDDHCSSMVIPLSAQGRMEFLCYSRAFNHSMWIAPVVEALQEKLKVEPSLNDRPVENLTVLPLAEFS